MLAVPPTAMSVSSTLGHVFFTFLFLFLDVDRDVIPSGALVPGSTTTARPTSPGPPGSGQTYPVPPFDTEGPISPTDNPPASAGAAAGTIILLVGAALGSLFAVNRALSSPSEFLSDGYSGQGHTATIPTSVGTVGFRASFLFQCASAVDPVSLLLHFQFLSFSGLLVLGYPLNYLGFTYNFAWANFLIPFPPFEKAASGLMSKSCWKAGLQDEAPSGGFHFLAARYGIPVHDLAGVVYICVSAGIGIALTFFVFVGVILLQLERTTKNSKSHETIKGFQERWAAISSNTTLRLVSDYIYVSGPYLMYCPIVYLDFGDDLYLRLFPICTLLRGCFPGCCNHRVTRNCRHAPHRLHAHRARGKKYRWSGCLIRPR